MSRRSEISVFWSVRRATCASSCVIRSSFFDVRKICLKSMTPYFLALKNGYTLCLHRRQVCAYPSVDCETSLVALLPHLDSIVQTRSRQVQASHINSHHQR